MLPSFCWENTSSSTLLATPKSCLNQIHCTSLRRKFSQCPLGKPLGKDHLLPLTSVAAWYRPSRREGDHHRNTTVGHLDVLSQQQAFQVLERCRVWMNSLLGADPESSWHKNPRRYRMGMYARMYASWYAFMCADLPHTRKNKREREREKSHS